MRRFFIMPALIVLLTSVIWTYETFNTKADEPTVEPLTEGITQEEVIKIVTETIAETETTVEPTVETRQKKQNHIQMKSYIYWHI